jgi:DNA-binding GntR family transcriptional regulator
MSKLHYSVIARELTEGIQSGRFALGSLLPTELELCAQYGTSRHSVRAALNELQQLGLVSRRKNVGTRVEANQRNAGYQQALASVEDLVQFGATHVRAVREVQETVADIALARELGCPGGTRWLRISSLRMSDGTPMGWTDAYIDPAYAELAELVRASPRTLISSLIEARYGRRIAQIHQEIQAVALPERLAPELNAQAGSPALKIVRRYVDAARQVVEVTVTVHPADRFTFAMQLNRTQG